MKNIAIFSNEFSVGGIQKSLINILNNTDYKKYNIDLYLMGKSTFFDNFPKEINIYYLGNLPKICSVLPFEIFKMISRNKVLKKEYDLAIDFDGYQKLTAVNAIECNAKKKVMWIHSDWYERIKIDKKFKTSFYTSKSKFKYFDEFIGVSFGVLDSFKKIYKKNINARVIPNLIDTNEIFKKMNDNIDLNIDNSKYNFCSVGRVCFTKGYDILLGYLNDLKNYRKDFHFYLIGDGEEMNNIISLAKKYDLDNYVTFLGLQKNPFKYMKQMDGFILTSRFEGQGIVLWEAKALGLDIFMGKNLEKYNDGLTGYKDLLSALRKAKKKKKTIDDLSKYNESASIELKKLFDGD